MAPRRLTRTEARRIALAAQGFDRHRSPRTPGLRDIRETIHNLGLLQIDYVTTVVPAQYQVLFSRLGPYDRSRLDDLVFRRREFTEQWAHEASIIPVESWPLLRYRMEAHRPSPNGFESFMRRHPEYVEEVLRTVRERGPVTADELPEPHGVSRRLDHAWFGTVPRAVLEAYFGRGVLAIANRLPNFARSYDLAERIIPERHRSLRVEREEAERELLRKAARAHGVATAGDLADYFRMRVSGTRPRIEDLVRRGDLVECEVEGWREIGYLPREAPRTDKVNAAALICPFDPLIWTRRRVARLFGFDYRFEIFIPERKRKWGSYVLPFLLGEQLVARVDLKTDRAKNRLFVRGAWLEDHARSEEVATPLAHELRLWAEWLGLGRVVIGRRGDFVGPLRRALQ